MEGVQSLLDLMTTSSKRIYANKLHLLGLLATVSLSPWQVAADPCLSSRSSNTEAGLMWWLLLLSFPGSWFCLCPARVSGQCRRTKIQTKPKPENWYNWLKINREEKNWSQKKIWIFFFNNFFNNFFLIIYLNYNYQKSIHKNLSKIKHISTQRHESKSSQQRLSQQPQTGNNPSVHQLIMHTNNKIWYMHIPEYSLAIKRNEC